MSGGEERKGAREGWGVELDVPSSFPSDVVSVGPRQPDGFQRLTDIQRSRWSIDLSSRL